VGPQEVHGQRIRGHFPHHLLDRPGWQHLIKVFENVKPDGHSAEVLAALKEHSE
jgi:peroxiredoxin